MRRRWAAVVLAAVATAGCAGSGDDRSGQPGDVGDRRQAMLELVRGDIRASSDDDPNALDFGDDGAECFATHVVDDVGLERLVALGYNPETGASPPTPIFNASLTPAERSRAFRALQGCVDLPTVLSQVFRRDAGLSAPEADCVAAAYLDSGLLEASLFSSAPDPELNQEIDATLAGAAESCAGS